MSSIVGWETNLQQMQQRQQPATSDRKVKASKPSADAQHMQQNSSTSHRHAPDSNGDPDEMSIPYDGLHLLECHGMTQVDTVISLERFLHQLPWSSVAPVVR